jgi:hypothetical protein
MALGSQAAPRELLQAVIYVDSHVAVSHVAVSHVAVSHFAAIFSGLEPKPQMILHLTPISNEYI